MVPYTTAESFNPEELWKWMATYEAKTGGKVLALAHNGNMSNGIMFPVEVNPVTGKKLGAQYMKDRIRWEPLYEVTQIKGDGETHPLLSPTDEFADFETLSLWRPNGSRPLSWLWMPVCSILLMSYALNVVADRADTESDTSPDYAEETAEATEKVNTNDPTALCVFRQFVCRVNEPDI